MGLFDGVGGTWGMSPWTTMTPLGVATSMGAAASAVGVPGFGWAPPAFPLIAGLGWSSRSSYYGHPEFRGVADIAIGSNDIQRGWSSGWVWGGGLGAFGVGAPFVGSGGYYIGPGPQFFDPMALFSWMYQQTFGVPQQPAGPAPAAAPQPAPGATGPAEKDQKADAGPAAKRPGSQRRAIKKTRTKAQEDRIVAYLSEKAMRGEKWTPEEKAFYEMYTKKYPSK